MARKRNSSSGIMTAIFGLTIAFVFVVYKYCLYVPIKWIIKKIKNNKSYKQTLNNNLFKEEPKIQDKGNKQIMSVCFKVAGITFEDRQKTIKKIVNESKNNIFHKPYYDMTNKEIIENGDKIYEINNLKVNSIRLEPTTLKNKDAIEIYITDLNKNEYLVGYVPKQKIDEVLAFLKVYQENPDYKLNADAYYTGGKYKKPEYDYEEDKEFIATYENNYGINVKLELLEK